MKLSQSQLLIKIQYICFRDSLLAYNSVVVSTLTTNIEVLTALQ